MAFRNRLRPINSVKHVVETSSIVAATTNTVFLNIATAVDAYTLADDDGVPIGSKLGNIYLSVFIYSEGGEVANEVPLADWYIIQDPSGNMGTTFSATALPTPGAQGTHRAKNLILHTEKGLAGGGDASLNGVPMVFKGVIRIPRGKQRISAGDQYKVCIRTNFAAKVCMQAIYKHFS